MSVKVAIIGAGPGGFYAADSLVSALRDCEVDIIEALPTPYGLIRFGVAPDHEKTRQVWRTFERTAHKDQVGFFGNVQVGQDLSVAELSALYDAVVIAVGAPADRQLEIPGADKAGVYGSAAFVGWYNGHPWFSNLNPDLATEAVAIIGNGNVALDVARVLVKTPDEMRDTDLPGYAAAAIHRAPIKDVYLIGRRGPNEAKWTNVELREIGLLRDCVPILEPGDLPDSVEGELSDRDRRLKEKNLANLRDLSCVKVNGRSKRLHFLFNAQPVEVLGEKKVAALRLERTRVESGRAIGTGETFDLPCGLLVASIGYRMLAVPGLPYDESAGIVPNQDGRVSPALYVVGWAKRGPSGVIGTSKPDGKLVARQIAAEISDGNKPGRVGLRRLLKSNNVRWVDFDEWKLVKSAEAEAAEEGAPRKKITSVEEMLQAIDAKNIE